MSHNVLIFMCTYQGELYIEQQLKSLLRQTHREWRLVISDDGSNDNTTKLITEFKKNNIDRDVKVIKGPRRGFANNFLTICQHAKSSDDYFAFCDQDDVWLENKLEKSLKKLMPFDAVPSLYCGRTRLIDEKNEVIGHSPLFKKKPSLRNALVQSIAGGNTMMFNRKAFLNLTDAIDPALLYVSHDWLLYQIVTAVGGQVIYDSTPTLLYRQHRTNQIGHNLGLSAKIKRLRMLQEGQFKSWNETHEIFWKMNSDMIDDNNIATIEEFYRVRKAALPGRFFGALRTSLYRQTFYGNLALRFSILVGKI